MTTLDKVWIALTFFACLAVVTFGGLFAPPDTLAHQWASFVFGLGSLRRENGSTLYRIVGILANRRVVSRYFAAPTEASAKVRMYKAFGMRVSALSAIPALPDDVGTVGYDEACNASETHAGTSRELRAQQSHAGADNTGRQMYKPAEATKTRVSNAGRSVLQSMFQ